MLGLGVLELFTDRQAMTLKDSMEDREKSIISALRSKQSGIDDRTGKGNATERIVQAQLLEPFLPPRFRCIKGAVVTSQKPQEQSKAIDRVIYDLTACSPLVHDEDHSIFPIEAVAGIVEITMRLDKSKLKNDIEHMAAVKAMRKRRYVVPVPATKTKAVLLEFESLSPRSYVIGLPEDPHWGPHTIAKALREIQLELGPPTHVHGLYVLGIGFFETIPVESKNEPMYQIKMWTGVDRLFQFTAGLRRDLDRWPRLQPGWTVDLGAYVEGAPEILED